VTGEEGAKVLENLHNQERHAAVRTRRHLWKSDELEAGEDTTYRSASKDKEEKYNENRSRKEE